MADSIVTKQALIDAQKDAQTLEEVISGEPGKLVETRLGRKVYTLASVPQINTMTREEVTEITETKANSVDVYQKTETYTKSEVDSTVAPKADQQYVDNALTGFTNGAAKFYPTIAAAQADIANISIKDKVEVGEAQFGGVWYKATAGSTYLTKSAYDPVNLARQLDEEKINNFSKTVYKSKLLNSFINEGIVDTATMAIGTSFASARSILVQVKPNTAYKLIKKQNTDRFVVNLFNVWPYQAGNAEVIIKYRTVKNSLDDGLTSGEVLFNTDSDTRYLHIYVSRSLSEEPQLELIELDGLEANLAVGQNISNPHYFDPLSFTFPADSQEINFLRSATNKTHILDCTGIGPQLAITRVNSDRFRVVAMVVDPTTKAKSFVRVGEYSGQSQVVNLPINTKYLLTFFQAVQEGAKLQILNSSSIQSYREFVKTLPDSVQLNQKATDTIKNEAASIAVSQTLSNLSETFDLDSKAINLNANQAINITPLSDGNGGYPEFGISANSRTYLIPVDQSSTYTIKKSKETEHMIVNEHAFFPIGRSSGHFIRNSIHAVRDGIATSGVFTIETSERTTWLSITVAAYTGIGSDLSIVKKEYAGSMFKKSKNLMNPNLKGLNSSVAYVDAITNPFAGGSTYRSAIVLINPNQTYTLTKFGKSDRFRVILINVNMDASRSYVNVIQQDGAKAVTFTTDSNSVFAVVYYSSNSEDVNLQLELGGQSTAFESYGYKLQAVNSFGQSGFPLTVIDTNYDVTAQLKSAFAQSENAIVYLNPGFYEFNETLNIPSNSRIIGLGEVVLKLKDTALLEKVVWRGTNVKTYLKTAETSKNAYLENIKVVGTETVDKSFLHFGVCIQGEGHRLVDVSADHVNWEVSAETENGERRSGGNGWGLVFYKAKSGKVKGGKFTYGGYENIGTDNAEDITFEDIYCGAGWRTSFQVHRNCKKITLINPTIEQAVTSEAQTHAALTIHGTPTEPVRSLKVIGGTIKALVGAQSPNGRGAVQSVEGNEHDVMLQGVTITSNKNGVVSSTNQPNKVEKWIITGCDIDAALDTVIIKGKHSAVTGNVLKGQRTAQFTGDEATTCVEANNVFIPVVSV